MNRGKLEQSLPCGKKATIIPIHKKGKDKKNPNSYQPISLLSCLGKLLEKVINRRLLSFLEDNNVLSQTQTGYRKHRNTEDQLALIAEEIENAFQEKKKVVAVFFDLTKAFDKVWREGLLLKVLQSRVSGRMYKWIRCFLQDRSARVKLDERSSTRRCHFTHTLVHQQHYNHSPKTCRTPYMQMIVLYGVQRTTLHLQPTGFKKLSQEYSSGQMSGVFRSAK